MGGTAGRIAEALESAILEGEFADGARLDESELSARFGVSRTPVREALGRLALSGLVRQEPRRGTFARQPGPAELLEMFEAMAELEASCGRFATRRASEAQLRGIAEADEACERALAAGEPDRYYRENEAFHRRIYEASGNGFLAGEATRLHRRLTPFRRLQLRLRGRLAESRAEHAAIRAAIEAGDPAAAAEALRAHVSVQGDTFHAMIAAARPAAE